MTREEALAAAIKLLCALPVLRWPLAGALVSIASTRTATPCGP